MLLTEHASDLVPSKSQNRISIAQGERLMEKTKMLELKSNWKSEPTCYCIGRWSLTPSNPRKGCQSYGYVLVDTGLRKTAWHYKAEEIRLGEKVVLWNRNKWPPGKWV